MQLLLVVSHEHKFLEKDFKNPRYNYPKAIQLTTDFAKCIEGKQIPSVNK